MKKRLLSCLLLVAITVCFISSIPFAGEDQTCTGTLTLEEVVANEQLQEEINIYLNSKLESSPAVMSAQEVNLSDV